MCASVFVCMCISVCIMHLLQIQSVCIGEQFFCMQEMYAYCVPELVCVFVWLCVHVCVHSVCDFVIIAADS